MRSQNKDYFIGFAITLLLLVQVQAASAAEVEIRIPPGVNASTFSSFSEEIGLAISYLPMAPAEPLGILGFDVGIELSAVHIDKGLWGQFTTSSSRPPSFVPFPKIHIQKGLPLSFDIGFVYSEVPSSNIKMYGGELKWAFISGNVALPAVAIRGSYTTLSGVNNFDLETIGADISISKGFAFVTPYAGYGQVWIDSKETITGSNFNESLSRSKPFIGAKISLAVINFVFEADFGAVPIYTARLNVGF